MSVVKVVVNFLKGSYVPARISANIFGLTIFFPLTGEEIEDMIDSVVVQVAQFRSGDHFDDSYVGGSEQVSSIPSSVEALCWEKITGKLSELTTTGLIS